MKFTRYDLPYDSYNKWKETCPEGSYRTVAPDLLENLLPHDLLSKTNSVVVMASGSPHASAFVANLNRVDVPDHAVDQQPYIVTYSHDDSSASGGFIHHGNWPGRTERPGKQFFDGISASGIQAFYPLSQMPISASGNLADLEVDSQKEAFWNSLSLLD